MPARYPPQLHGPFVLAAYVAVAFVGLSVASVGSMISAIWPATGVALTALWVLGSRAVPWIWIGSLVVNLTVVANGARLEPAAAVMVVVIASMNTLGPVLAWQVLSRQGARVVMESFRDMGWFYAAAALAAAMTAVAGSLTMFGAGQLALVQVPRALGTWWAGDLLGYVVVTPALVYTMSREMAWRAGRAPLVASFAAALLFGVDPLGLSAWLDVSWLPLVPLVWLGAEAGAGGLAIGFIGVALVFMTATALGQGSFVAAHGADPYLAIGLWLGPTSAAAYAAGVLITQWRTAMEEARATGQRLEQLVGALPAATVQIDGFGRVHLNPAAGRLAGVANLPEMPREVWVRQTFVEPEAALREMVRLTTPRVAGAREATFDLKGTGEAVRRVRLVGAPAGDGEVWILEDVTERDAYEAELRAAKEAAEAGLRAKSEFLATMSHEIRTPLNGVIGVAEVLRGTKLTPEQRQWLDTLSVSAESLLALLHDILDFSRLEEGRWRVAPQAVDPCAPAQEVVRMLTPGAAARGVAVRLNVSPDMPELVRTDAACLRQILLNLVGNAVKFTEAGSVTIELSWESGVLVAEVVDTGIGMGELTLARVFEPFTQAERGTNRKYGGTGLGLSISKRLAAALDGTLTARSEPGRGSRFTLRIPAEMARATRRKPSALLVRPPLGLRVLVAEDNPVNRAVTRALLEDLGSVVGLATDGAAAVDMATAEPWDVVLMDCRMPGMDGYTAARTLRESGFGKPILAMTAGAFASDRDAAFAAGMDEWLVKPVTLAALAEALDRWGRRVGGTQPQPEPPGGECASV
jgi:signal transduction histidine kinase/integral membrane sensor domain MASE1/ActR/RegA family two-component response regulator